MRTASAWQMQCGRNRLFIDGRGAVHMVIATGSVHHEAFSPFLTRFFGQLVLKVIKVACPADRDRPRRT